MPPALRRNVDLSKTITYLLIHLSIGFSVAYLFTGSVAVAGGIALVEPMVNAVAFFIHEKVWKRALILNNLAGDASHSIDQTAFRRLARVPGSGHAC